jgi:beta-glucosidase
VLLVDFNYGWFMDPLTKGSYPDSMVKTLGDRLPSFTEDQQKILVRSLDFVALNYYFPYMSTSGTFNVDDTDSWYKDQNVTNYFNSSWPLSQTGWGIYGPGLKDLLIYTEYTYGIPSYVTENGLAWEELTIRDAVDDINRQNYLYDHIQAVGDAITLKANVKGYFIWSFEV